MVKILCIGDIHVQTNNIKQINDFLDKLIDFLTNKEKVDIVVLMGDILHTHERLHTIAFNTVTDIFKKISALCKTYVLVGNHDYINNSQFLSSNHWMNCFKEYHNLVIVDNVLIETVSDKKLVFCPYVPDGRFREALDSLGDERWKTADYIFAHQLFDGAKMGAIVAEHVEKWEEDLPLVISGHIHDKQKLQDNLIYTGSCLQHAFGESSDKTLLFIDNDEIKYIDLHLCKKKILYMEIDEVERFDFSLLEENTEYKIVANGDNNEFSNFRKTSIYRDIIKRGIKIVFKQKRVEILQRNELLRHNFQNHQTVRSFKEILEELVVNSDDSKSLSPLFHEIVLQQKRKNNDDEILFIDE